MSLLQHTSWGMAVFVRVQNKNLPSPCTVLIKHLHIFQGGGADIYRKEEFLFLVQKAFYGT
jgi:hypothetical protein